MRVYSYRLSMDQKKILMLYPTLITNYPDHTFDQPVQIVKMLDHIFHLRYIAEDLIWMISVDSKNKVINIFEISRGFMSSNSFIDPKEIFMRSSLCGAKSFVIVRYSLNRKTKMTAVDEVNVDRLSSSGQLMGIQLLDYIIIGKNIYSHTNNKFEQYELPRLKSPSKTTPSGVVSKLNNISGLWLFTKPYPSGITFKQQHFVFYAVVLF